jgi:hypothetical protein
MDMPTAIRRVRIAVSVFVGVCALAVLVLWVRSYSRYDRFEITDFSSRYVYFVSIYGRVTVGQSTYRSIATNGLSRTRFKSGPAMEVYDGLELFGEFKTDPHSRLQGHFAARINELGAPHWAIALCFLLFAVAPSARYFAARFSLRTMFIATTLVAVVLGLGVWLVR